jgi:Uma2 family endonuclease
MIAIAPPLTLEAFLALPEADPALEFVNGEAMQKPMPQGDHSRLQFKLCAAVNQVAETQKVACAFPELRCVFGGDVIVPDVAVFRWDRIPRTETGRLANRFELHPDWTLEILSPGQSSTKLLGKLLLCMQAGTELGWLIDPSEDSILVILPEQRVQLFTGNAVLPVLRGIDLALTVQEVFQWLML